jgi:cysteine desulfurase / selenocysteine lyase
MNVRRLRAEFPALEPRGDGPALDYLDSACQSLVPRAVLEAMEEYYTEYPGCAGRSVHRFSEEAGRRVEETRAAFGRFFGRSDPDGVVFLRNATEAINLVAQGTPWRRGDRVLVTDREHNSNLVVWQRLVRERGIRLDVLPLDDGGGFDPDRLDSALARGVRWVSVFHTSNLDGRSLPVREIAERAHDRGARLLVDGCQAAPHRRVAFDRLGADAYAVSAHKMLGPTGVGALVATGELLGELRPLAVGGETVEWTTVDAHALRPPPHRFEAGLQNYAGVLGAHAGLRFLERVGLEAVEAQQLAVGRAVARGLAGERRVRVLGPPDPEDRPSVFAFTLDGVDPHDAAVYLDEGHGVLVRSGMHCVHSFYAARGLPGNVRASFYLYNDRTDAEALVEGVRALLALVPGPGASGTSAGTARSGPRAARARRPGAGSAAAAARSARPRRRAARGRAASAGGSG